MTKKSKLKQKLVITTALMGATVLGYGRRAYAVCNGSNPYTCNGPYNAQQYFTAPGTSVTVASGFGVNTATGYGVYIKSTGNLTFTDNTGVNSAYVKGNYSGLRVSQTGAGAGNITINADSKITGSSGVSTINNGTGATDLTINGDVSGTTGQGISAYNKGTNLSITASNVTSLSLGISANNQGKGTTDITINGDVTSTNDNGVDVYGKGTNLSVTANNVTSKNAGIRARNYGTGTTTLAVNGDVYSANNRSIDAYTKGTDLSLTTAAASAITGETGIRLDNNGTGKVTAIIDGDVTSNNGSALSINNAATASDVTVITGANSYIHDNNTVGASSAISITNNATTSKLDITVKGNITSSDYSAINATHYGNGNFNITTYAGKTVSAKGNGFIADSIRAINNGTAALNITANSDITSSNRSGIYATNNASATTAYIKTGTASYIKSKTQGLYLRNYSTTSGSTIKAYGKITSTNSHGIYAKNTTGNLAITTGTNEILGSGGQGINTKNSGNTTTIIVNGDVTASSNGIEAYNNSSNAALVNAINITTSAGYTIQGKQISIVADNQGYGAVNITAGGNIYSTNSYGIKASNTNKGSDINITTNAGSYIKSNSTGLNINNQGTGATDINISGKITSTNNIGMYVKNTTGDLAITTGTNAISGNNGQGIYANNAGNTTTITVNGNVTGSTYGILAYNNSSNAALVNAINITTAAGYTIQGGSQRSIVARNSGYGAVNITAGGNIYSTSSQGIQASNTNKGSDINITTNAGSYIKSYTTGLNINNQGTGATDINISGKITSSSGAGITASNAGTDLDITLNSGSYLKANSMGIYAGNTGSGTTNITVNGDIAAGGAGIALTSAGNITINNSKVSSTNNYGISASGATKLILDGSISKAAISGSTGAMQFSSANDSVTIKGDVDITGKITAGTGTDDLDIQNGADVTLDSSDITDFETINISGNVNIAAGKTTTITTTADAIEVDGGTLTLGVASNTSFAKIITTNGINFTNGGLLTIDASSIGTIKSGTTLTNILSGGTITGLTSGLLTDNNSKYDFLSIVNGSSVDVCIVAAGKTICAADNVFASAGSGNSNTAAIGSVLDSISASGSGSAALQNLITNISNLSTDTEKAAAIKTLMPDTSGATIQGAVAAQDAAIGTIESRMETTRMAGVSTGGEGNNKGVWGQVFGKDITQGFRKGVDGFDADVSGLSVGSDGAIGDDTRLGVAFSYAATDTDSINSSAKINSYQVTTYASYDLGKSFIEGLGSVGFNDNKTDRTLSNGTVAHGEFGSHQFALKGAAGYNANPFPGWTFTPIASLQYNYLIQEEYTETGSSAPLHIDNNDVASLKSGLGLKISRPFDFAGYRVKPKISGTWQYDFLAEATESDSYFTSAAANQFNSRGAKPSPNSFKFSTGVDVLSADNVTVSFDYNWEAALNYRAHTGMAKVRVEF